MASLRIAIDGHAMGSRLTGNETYIRNLLMALGALDTHNEYLLLVTHPEVAKEWRDRFANFRPILVPNNAPQRLLVSLPLELARHRPSLLHVQYTAPPICPVPVVTTIHDISFEHFPAFFTRRERTQFRTTIPWTARRAAAVLTVSEYSRQDLLRTYGLPPEKVTVTPNGVSQQFIPADQQAIARVRDRYGITGPYLLALGNLQPRKNLPALLEAFSDLAADHPHQLVIVGKKAWLFDEIFAEIGRSDVRDRIILTDYVPDDDLAPLYSGAECFVYPSLFEGFGLPPLEAMACGTAVVVGDNSSLPEVVGEAGLRVNSADPRQLERAIRRLLSEPELRRELTEAGRSRARSFTWEECARRTLEVYQAVAKGAR